MCMKKMWSSSKIYSSAAVFYSAFFFAKCQADDIPGLVLKEQDDSFRIYRTEVPWTPIGLHQEKNFAVMAWIAVLSVVVSATAIVCLFCLCWKLYPKYTHVETFQADGGIRNSITATGHVYSSGVMNFFLTTSLHDPVIHTSFEDDLPPYSEVVSQASDKSKPANETVYPPVTDTKTVETPPPAYVTVAPFQ